MSIKMVDIFKAFAVWSGASMLVYLLNALSYQLQLLQPLENSENWPFNIEQYAYLVTAVIFFLCRNLWPEQRAKLLLLFTSFEVLLDFLQYHTSILRSMLCEGSYCLAVSDVQFLWQATLQSLVGYMVAFLLLVKIETGSGTPASAGARFGSMVAYLLQYDAKAMGHFWRRWLQLPLWTYWPAIKKALKAMVLPFCAVAAANMAGWILIMFFWPLLEGPFSSLVDQQNPMLGMAFSQSYSLFFYMVCALFVGHYLGSGKIRLSRVSIFMGVVLINWLYLFPVFVQIIPAITSAQFTDLAYSLSAVSTAAVQFIGMRLGNNIGYRKALAG
jgi:hypothetical protein